MRCPKCHEEIITVNIISECWQRADVNEKGAVTNYGGIEEILETVKIEHGGGNCYADLTDIISE